MNLKFKVAAQSIQDYLESEATSPVKREFIKGDMYAMAGASTNHNRLVANIVREFGNHLKNTPCEAFASDMKVQVANDFFYPDTVVACHQQANDDGITDTPLLIVEVLSKSTRRLDHTLKRSAYQHLASLQEYIVVEQDLVDIEVCRRKNHWQSEHYYLGDNVFFAAIDLQLPVTEIYDRVVNTDMLGYLQRIE